MWLKRLFRRKPKIQLLGYDISSGKDSNVFIYGFIDEDGTINITNVEVVSK